MSAIDHPVFVGSATEGDMTEARAFLPRHTAAVELQRAEQQVQFYLARAKEAELIGRPKLTIELLRAAESWQQIADGLRGEITE
jgi:hypothetical protein